jgi:acyl carrier protein
VTQGETTLNDTTDIEARVRGYILENLLFSSDGSELPNDASLLDRGIIDSTGVLEIVLFLESEFGIAIKASEMLPENFDSVNNMVRFVQRLRTPA